jgi:hypothetical protein
MAAVAQALDAGAIESLAKYFHWHDSELYTPH